MNKVNNSHHLHNENLKDSVDSLKEASKSLKQLQRKEKRIERSLGMEIVRIEHIIENLQNIDASITIKEK